MKRLLLLLFCLMVLFGFSGCGAKEQISYDFDTYLSYNNSFEKNLKLVMPSKDELKDSIVLDYVYYDSGATVFEPYRMIQMTVKYSDELFLSEKEELEKQSIELDSSFETERFYFNGILYQGSLFYNDDARDDEFEDTYNDGYCAFAYHVSTESNTISYIAFESGDLQYMDMQSALTLFPEFEGSIQVVSADNIGDMLTDATISDVDTLSEAEKSASVSDSFTADTFFDVKEGEHLSDEEIRTVISDIPSDQYESYPDTHNVPISATLYKDGKAISLDRDDPRLIGIINLFNNCVYHSQCGYTQGLLSLDYLEENVIGYDFRLELKYTPCSDTGPSPYGKSTTGCDTIIVTNSSSGFTLIAHEIPGYEGQEERYPYCAVGFAPLYNSYPWLDLFEF